MILEFDAFCVRQIRLSPRLPLDGGKFEIRSSARSRYNQFTSLVVRSAGNCLRCCPTGVRSDLSAARMGRAQPGANRDIANLGYAACPLQGWSRSEEHT